MRYLTQPKTSSHALPMAGKAEVKQVKGTALRVYRYLMKGATFSSSRRKAYSL